MADNTFHSRTRPVLGDDGIRLLEQPLIGIAGLGGVGGGAFYPSGLEQMACLCKDCRRRRVLSQYKCSQRMQNTYLIASGKILRLLTGKGNGHIQNA